MRLNEMDQQMMCAQGMTYTLQELQMRPGTSLVDICRCCGVMLYRCSCPTPSPGQVSVPSDMVGVDALLAIVCSRSLSFG